MVAAAPVPVAAEPGPATAARIACVTSAGSGTNRGSGGMASKLSAARMASWSGVSAVIAKASRPNVLADAVAQISGTGTFFRPHGRRTTARKLVDACLSRIADPSGEGARAFVHVDAEAAIEAARVPVELLDVDRGDRMTVVVFNAGARVAVSLTNDRGALNHALTQVTTSPGSRIETGVALAAVGLLPLNRVPIPHDIAAFASLVLFAVAAAATVTSLPGPPRALLVTSVGVGLLLADEAGGEASEPERSGLELIGRRGRHEL